MWSVRKLLGKQAVGGWWETIRSLSWDVNSTGVPPLTHLLLGRFPLLKVVLPSARHNVSVAARTRDACVFSNNTSHLTGTLHPEIGVLPDSNVGEKCLQLEKIIINQHCQSSCQPSIESRGNTRKKAKFLSDLWKKAAGPWYGVTLQWPLTTPLGMWKQLKAGGKIKIFTWNLARGSSPQRSCSLPWPPGLLKKSYPFIRVMTFIIWASKFGIQITLRVAHHLQLFQTLPCSNNAQQKRESKQRNRRRKLKDGVPHQTLAWRMLLNSPARTTQAPSAALSAAVPGGAVPGGSCSAGSPFLPRSQFGTLTARLLRRGELPDAAVLQQWLNVLPRASFRGAGQAATATAVLLSATSFAVLRDE